MVELLAPASLPHCAWTEHCPEGQLAARCHPRGVPSLVLFPVSQSARHSRFRSWDPQVRMETGFPECPHGPFSWEHRGSLLCLQIWGRRGEESGGHNWGPPAHARVLLTLSWHTELPPGSEHTVPDSALLTNPRTCCPCPVPAPAAGERGFSNSAKSPPSQSPPSSPKQRTHIPQEPAPTLFLSFLPIPAFPQEQHSGTGCFISLKWGRWPQLDVGSPRTLP